jgi:hypothetical protein
MIRFVLLFILAISLFNSVVTADNPSNNNTKKTSQTNGIELDASIPTEVQIGRPVELYIKMTNNGKNAFSYGEIDGFQEFGINIFNNKGNPVARRKRGAGGIGTTITQSRWVLRVLKPGESVERNIDLSQYFAFDTSGYSISISVELDRDVNPSKVSIEGLAFKITPK